MNDIRVRDEVSRWAVELVDARRDLDEIQAIDRESFPQPWGDETFTRELRKYPLSRIYVVRVDGTGAVGFCAVWVVADELHINSLAIGRRWRRRGAARALLARVLVAAHQLGARRATLEVRASNVAARRLYEGIGFTVTATRSEYYSKPVEDALILGRDLESPLRV